MTHRLRARGALRVASCNSSFGRRAFSAHRLSVIRLGGAFVQLCQQFPKLVPLVPLVDHLTGRRQDNEGMSVKHLPRYCSPDLTKTFWRQQDRAEGTTFMARPGGSLYSTDRRRLAGGYDQNDRLHSCW